MEQWFSNGGSGPKVGLRSCFQWVVNVWRAYMGKYEAKINTSKCKFSRSSIKCLGKLSVLLFTLVTESDHTKYKFVKLNGLGLWELPMIVVTFWFFLGKEFSKWAKTKFIVWVKNEFNWNYEMQLQRNTNTMLPKHENWKQPLKCKTLHIYI